MLNKTIIGKKNGDRPTPWPLTFYVEEISIVLTRHVIYNIFVLYDSEYFVVFKDNT